MRDFLIILLLGFAINGYSQEYSPSIDSLKKMFNSFEYMKVITYSGKLLLNKELDSREKTEILKMKAISHYLLWDEQSSELYFLELLKINRDYELDTRETSPKIVAFFNKIKDNYLYELYKEIAKKDSLEEIKPVPPEQRVVIVKEQNYNYLKSMIIPGWGQYCSGEKVKGISFGILSSAALISSVYFIFDANRKEKEYLRETDPANIESMYQDYNTAYKWRNISLAIYSALWIYLQLDFYIFPKNPVQEQITLAPLLSGREKWDGVIIRYKINF